jgi:hypothetical protein
LLRRNRNEKPWGGPSPVPYLSVELDVHWHSISNAQRPVSAKRPAQRGAGFPLISTSQSSSVLFPLLRVHS